MTGGATSSVLPPLVAEWPFPVPAALGSAIRAQGIEREIRNRLPFPDRKRLTVGEGRIRLVIPAGEDARLEIATEIVSDLLEEVGGLPVIPSEVEDILSISSRERQKWTKDGRLRSAGTRTVRLRGRAKEVTFHVFDPRHIEDVLDRDMATIWREEDAQATAENRKRGAGKAAQTRAGKGVPKEKVRRARRDGDDGAPDIEGWEAFAAEGLLR